MVRPFMPIASSGFDCRLAGSHWLPPSIIVFVLGFVPHKTGNPWGIGKLAVLVALFPVQNAGRAFIGESTVIRTRKACGCVMQHPGASAFAVVQPVLAVRHRRTALASNLIVIFDRSLTPIYAT